MQIIVIVQKMSDAGTREIFFYCSRNFFAREKSISMKGLKEPVCTNKEETMVTVLSSYGSRHVVHAEEWE